MKMLVILLSVAALASAAPLYASLESRSVKDDLKEFENLIPKEKISEIVLIYISCDKEVGAVAEYLQSGSFGEFLSALNDIPEIIELRNYIGNLVPADVRNLDDSLIEISALSSDDSQTVDGDDSANCELQPITGGLRGLVKDIFAVLPLDQIKALFVEKMKTSPEFRNLVSKLTSPELKDIIRRLKANPEFQQLVLKAKNDVIALIDQVHALVAELNAIN